MTDKPAAKLAPRPHEIVTEKATRRGIRGWMLFDWAAQPFFTVVTTFIFGPYFVSRLAENPVEGQKVWALGLTISGILIAVLSPILGSIADQTGPRKPWIAGFAALKIIALSLLWFAAPGSSLFWVVAAFSLASVAAEFSTVFNDSMMPRLVPEKDIGRVSNIAWGLGYAGGMIVLIFVIACLAASPETGTTIIGMKPLFGLDPLLGEDARFTGPLSAAWYFVFILPMFLFTPDGARKVGMSFSKAVSHGLAELKTTFANVRRKAGLARFLIARMLYQDGVNALLALGGTYAAAMFKWSITEIGIFGIILNIVAIPSCILAGKLDTNFGSKRIVMASIVALTLATLGIVSTGTDFTLFGALAFSPPVEGDGLFGSAAEKAYIVFGLLIGIAFGPIQASSRSYMARSIPADDAGSYFGLYALTGRVTSFLAPAAVSFITAYTQSARYGMAVILVFLLAGGLLLRSTPYPAADPNEH